MGNSPKHTDRIPRSNRASSWNELRYMSVHEFTRMAPTVVGLEVARLDELARRLSPGSALHEAVVTARYRLHLFLDEINGLSDDASKVNLTSLEACSEHIDASLLCMAAGQNAQDPTARGTFEYVAGRLDYIHSQIHRLF